MRQPLRQTSDCLSPLSAEAVPPRWPAEDPPACVHTLTHDLNARYPAHAARDRDHLSPGAAPPERRKPAGPPAPRGLRAVPGHARGPAARRRPPADCAPARCQSRRHPRPARQNHHAAKPAKPATPHSQRRTAQPHPDHPRRDHPPHPASHPPRPQLPEPHTRTAATTAAHTPLPTSLTATQANPHKAPETARLSRREGAAAGISGCGDIRLRPWNTVTSAAAA
jgi:hypothetical protein